ncbi:uncharacterized protein LOC101848017 [Aplysia californica]|uniref:Uncharacterized protein LOC101848017 n=1 Tax=Aplysia californica TaxID=6500 RepID=A0ABM0KAJ7_APLCA|nr:uncharacterized protein LOC101848017 [Aplysia californica]
MSGVIFMLVDCDRVRHRNDTDTSTTQIRQRYDTDTETQIQLRYDPDTTQTQHRITEILGVFSPVRFLCYKPTRSDRDTAQHLLCRQELCNSRENVKREDQHTWI